MRHRREKVRLQAIELFEPRQRALQALVVLGQLGERQAHRLFVRRRREVARVRVMDEQPELRRDQLERGLCVRSARGDRPDAFAIVIERLVRPGDIRSGQQPIVTIVDRDLAAQGTPDGVDQLVELGRWDQARQLDRNIDDSDSRAAHSP